MYNKQFILFLKTRTQMKQYKHLKILKVNWLSIGGFMTMGIVYCEDIITNEKKTYIGVSQPYVELGHGIPIFRREPDEELDIEIIINSGRRFKDEDFNNYLESLKITPLSSPTQI